MSSNDIAISIRGVGKRYTLRHQGEQKNNLAEGLIAWTKRGFRSSSTKETFWALKDISFDVKHGQVLGIIGRNGAGKSTLLKILSRITELTEGEVHINGRVGSLLEVGTGFHPELTGRENVFLNGSILGMRRAEVQKHFDAIVDFSGVEKFLDTPVKRYSSGMYVRLAFAVAAHLEPDILIIDEVLAVGDAEFQKKCLGKMGEVAQQGRTVLFVSHNMGAVAHLTGVSARLSAGRLINYGPTAEIIREYLDEGNPSNDSEKADIKSYRRSALTADTPIFFRDVWISSDKSGLTRSVKVGTVFTLHVIVEARRAIAGALINAHLKNSQSQTVVVLFSWDDGFRLNLDKGVHEISIEVRGFTPTEGRVYADIGLNQSTNTRAYDVLIDYPLMNVVVSEDLLEWPERKWGLIQATQVNWSVKRADYLTSERAV